MFAVTAVSIFASCSTTRPEYEHSSFSIDSSFHKELGRTTVHFDKGKVAYYKLVEESQKNIFAQNDVVNIMVDVEDEIRYVRNCNSI